MRRRDILRSLPFAGAAYAAWAKPEPVRGASDGPLSVEYLDGIRRGIERIRDTESDDLLRAAEAIARTRRNGGNCFYQWETNHTIEGDMFPGRHGDTDLFVMGYSMGTPVVAPKPGDLLLVNVIRAPLEDPRARGVFVVGGSNPWCADLDQGLPMAEANRKLRVREYSDIWIDLPYTPYGALVHLPGQEVPLGPTPGAFGMATCWAMVADAVRLLVRDGIPVRVSGDESPLGSAPRTTRLDRPLAGAWFAEILRQIGAIPGEFSVIRALAVEIADRILAGGKLHVYSRYREALCQEANQRRGGLALINATWAGDQNFRGSGKDIVIMGITRPEDRTDLAMLDRCRGMGMKVAVIGPATRDGRIPSGRTLPGEADYHLGRMTDTYGLFALPGLDRKICPASGLLVNVIFWTVMVQLAEELIRRTGNSPAVLSTGAVVGGAEQRARCAELVKTRGY